MFPTRTKQPDEPPRSIGPVGPAHHDGNQHLPEPERQEHDRPQPAVQPPCTYWLPESTARWSPWGSGHERTETTEVYMHGDQADHRRGCARTLSTFVVGEPGGESWSCSSTPKTCAGCHCPGFRQSRTSRYLRPHSTSAPKAPCPCRPSCLRRDGRERPRTTSHSRRVDPHRVICTSSLLLSVFQVVPAMRLAFVKVTLDRD